MLMDAICSFYHDERNDEGTLAVQNNIWNNSYCMHCNIISNLLLFMFILFCTMSFSAMVILLLILHLTGLLIMNARKIISKVDFKWREQNALSMNSFMNYVCATSIDQVAFDSE